MQASLIGDTVLVLMSLEKYMTPEQRSQVPDEASLLMASISPCHVGLIDVLFQPSG